MKFIPFPVAKSMRGCIAHRRAATLPRIAVLGILVVHGGLLAYSAARHSPTTHETAHLPAGICHWEFGMFELYRVNPPLPRMIAALPVLFCDPETDWGNYQLGPFARETIPMGVRFAKANGARTLFLFMVARWACIPFCLLGGWVCYRWAAEFWGNASGMVALVLWCFNPFVLGHGALVMPDVPAAAMGVFAAWRFWKWLREPAWPTAAQAGLALGLAELCKTTLLVFFILWPAAWLLASGTRKRAGNWSSWWRQAAQLTAILVLAVYIINLGYAFKSSFQRLGDYRFQSHAFSGQPVADPPKPGNHFKASRLANFPIPLPRDYVQGIDRQRTDFERGMPSYFHGRWFPRGWWYYYLVGLGIKLPIGTLALLAVTAVVTMAELVTAWPATLRLRGGNGEGLVRFAKRSDSYGLAKQGCMPERSSCQARQGDTSWRDELLLLSCGIAILALVSSQTGFSAHVRYAIPALPILFIWCGKLFVSHSPAVQTDPKRQRGGVIGRLPPWRLGLLSFCLVAGILESLSVYPHSISFFNRLIGGPMHGHEWLLDSNSAWGQDLIYLKEWVERHPEARPLHLATVGWPDPQALGIDYTVPRAIHSPPQPGWYIVDVNFLHGTPWAATRGELLPPQTAADDVSYDLRLFQPCENIAYSFHVYNLARRTGTHAAQAAATP